jgi:hypothetical protein
MYKNRKKLPDASGIPANQLAGTALFDIPVGPRYRQFRLVAGDANGIQIGTNNFIQEVRFNIDGKVQRRVLAKELDLIYSAYGEDYRTLTYGNPGTATYRSHIPLHFNEDWRREVAGGDSLSISTRNLETVTLELDIKAGVTNPTLQLYAEYDDSIMPKGMTAEQAATQPWLSNFVKWYRQMWQANGSDSVEITQFDFKRKAEWLQSIYLSDADNGAKLTKVRLEVNNEVKLELETDVNDSFNKSRGIIPLASGYQLELDHDDLIGSALPLANVTDMKINLWFDKAATGNVTAIVQRLGARD